MQEVSFTMTGVVEQGFGKARGSGYPTANLSNVRGPTSHILEGVYCGWTRINGAENRIPSIVFYGIPHAIPDVRAPRCEVHLFEQAGDLYGKKLSVELAAFIRENKKFDDRENLQKAIEGDIEMAREYFRLSSRASLRHSEQSEESRDSSGKPSE